MLNSGLDERMSFDQSDGAHKVVALKTDRRKFDQKFRLTNEVNILVALQGKKTGKYFRFPILYETVITGHRLFLTMNVFGHNLVQLRDQCVRKGENFNRKSAAILVAECFKAVIELHHLGFLHRDVKMSNFCVGYEKEQYQNVYLIDYASSCKMDDKQTSIVRAESMYPLLGHGLIFASLEAHRGEMHTRKSDLLSMLFVAIDIHDRDILPWKKYEDAEKVEKLKNKFLNERDMMMSPLPRHLLELTNVIEAFSPADVSKYYDEILRIVGEARTAAEMDKKSRNLAIEWLNMVL